MGKVELLRKLIREEVIKAIRQELPKILSENKSLSNGGVKNVIKEMKRANPFPLTLNTVETYQRPSMFPKNSPMSDLLNETAAEMGAQDAEEFLTEHSNPILGFQPAEVGVGDINTMLSTARPSTAFEAVQINDVPDYSGLMKKMLDKGIM